MSRRFICACLAVACGFALSAAEPVKAVLVVQNHVTSGRLTRPLTDLAPLLSEALSSSGVLRIVNPSDMVGTTQNRGQAGERLPESSSVRLAENCGAWLLVTASVNGMSVKSFGQPVLVKQLSARVTLEAKCVPGGESLGGTTFTVLSPKKTPADFEENLDNVYEELTDELCHMAAESFLPKIRDAIHPPAAAQKVAVGFGCNVAGASVEIDGIARGTAGVGGGAPLRVEVSQGLHHLTVRYPFMIPYEVTAMFSEPSTFNIVLALTEEGRMRAQNEDRFRTLLSRLAKSGAVDDAVRQELAKGQKAYLTASYSRIRGMPQSLAISSDIRGGFLDMKVDGGAAGQVERTTDDLKREVDDASKK